MRYAFIDSGNLVVNVIVGVLNEQQQAQFLNDYHTLFGAVAILEVPEGVSVWIGGVYDSEQGYLPPAVPEPEPEPAPEPQPEPQPEPLTEPEL
jgi:hypothetical protein